MILADFNKYEANTKLMQQKVARNMPMKAKKASLTTANVSIPVSSGPPIGAVILDKDGMSPTPNNETGCISSLTTPDETDNATRPECKPPIHCSNAKQKQEQRESILRTKAKYS
jgi:hypothetical protein